MLLLLLLYIIFILFSTWLYNDYCTDLNFEYYVQFNANYIFDSKFLNLSMVFAFMSSSDRVFHS